MGVNPDSHQRLVAADFKHDIRKQHTTPLRPFERTKNVGRSMRRNCRLLPRRRQSGTSPDRYCHCLHRWDRSARLSRGLDADAGGLNLIQTCRSGVNRSSPSQQLTMHRRSKLLHLHRERGAQFSGVMGASQPATAAASALCRSRESQSPESREYFAQAVLVS